MTKSLTRKKSITTFNKAEKQLLEQIAAKIRKDLYDLEKPLEWLAWEAEVARSTVQRVLDADRNIGIITLDRVAKGLGYKNIVEFLSEL